MASNKWDKIKEAYESAEHFLADMPIAKAIGGVIANPTPQEVGAQISNLGSDVSKGLQEFTNRVYSDPSEAGSLVSPIGAMVAWHGSPHKFSKFSTSKIGTGEGHQAYGHGLYAAGNKEVAQEYQRVLSSDKMGDYYRQGDQIKEAINRNKQYQEVLEGKRASMFVDKNGNPIPNSWYEKTIEENNKFIKDATEWMAKNNPSGNLYKVDIPEESQMLDWDTPVSKQHIEVKDKLLKAIDQIRPDYAKEILSTDAPGGTVVKQLGVDLGEEQASKYLNSLGIKGIKYLDQGSRAAGQGTRNYVIFNDKDVKILERNAEKFLEE